jgi:hypothetical protein
MPAGNMRRKIAGLAAALLALAGMAAGCASGRSGMVCGRVTDDAGRAVAGATVTAGPSGESAVTDGQGTFCLAAAGKVSLSVEAPEPLCPLEPREAQAGSWSGIVLERRLLAPSKYQVGFGAPVSLTARLRCGGQDAVFRWRQIAGPAVGAPGSEWEGATLSFETRPLDLRAGKPGVLALSPAHAGWYRFEVEARTGTQVLKTEVEVTAASATSGVLSVPVDTDVYLDTGTADPGAAWSITSAPPASQAQCLAVPTADGTGGVVRLRPDRPGAYEIMLEPAGKRIVLEVGLWSSVPQDCQRPECHPSEYRGWLLSPHASALSNRFSVPAAQAFEGRCLTCHTVGYNPGSDSGGFDDVAGKLGITVRNDFPGGDAALPLALKRLGDVWCVCCHGPGRLPEHGKRSLKVKADICGQCHDSPPDYPTVQEWNKALMSKSTAHDGVLEPACAGCHTAQGAVARMRGRIVTAVDPDLAQPVACAACHVAHTENAVLLRATGTAVTASGLLFEAGRGAVCIGCHQAGHKADEESEKLRLAPLASQAEIQLGGGAYGLKSTPANIHPDLCINCHMGMRESGVGNVGLFGGHTFKAPWVDPEAPRDCDGDGKADPLGEEYALCMEKVEQALMEKIHALPGCGGSSLGQAGLQLLPLAPDGSRLPACETQWFKPGASPLYRLAYDYYLVKRDGSRGAHNPLFTILLLRKILEKL